MIYTIKNMHAIVHLKKSKHETALLNTPKYSINCINFARCIYQKKAKPHNTNRARGKIVH